MILSNKGITKALIRLRRCAGWSAPVLFSNPRRRVFSRRGPFHVDWSRAICLVNSVNAFVNVLQSCVNAFVNVLGSFVNAYVNVPQSCVNAFVNVLLSFVNAYKC